MSATTQRSATRTRANRGSIVGLLGSIAGAASETLKKPERESVQCEEKQPEKEKTWVSAKRLYRRSQEIEEADRPPSTREVSRNPRGPDADTPFDVAQRAVGRATASTINMLHNARSSADCGRFRRGSDELSSSCALDARSQATLDRCEARLSAVTLQLEGVANQLEPLQGVESRLNNRLTLLEANVANLSHIQERAAQAANLRGGGKSAGRRIREADDSPGRKRRGAPAE
eukprot:1708516-Prymnesium_polylepis.1